MQICIVCLRGWLSGVGARGYDAAAFSAETIAVGLLSLRLSQAARPRMRAESSRRRLGMGFL